MSPLVHVSGSLTNDIFVPNCSKAQDKQALHYQYIQRREEAMDISYSSPYKS